MSDLAHRSGDEVPGQNAADKAALLSIPQAFRLNIARLWTFNADLLPSPLVLCVRTKYWIAEFGLTEEELAEIVRRLMIPERSATHKFPRDLVNDITTEVATAAKRRRAQAEAEERRSGGPKTSDEEKAKIRELLDEFKNRTAAG